VASKITQFQVDLERLALYSYDVAQDWVFDPDSELYRKYKGLRKEDFIKLMAKDGDEPLMTKIPLVPIGVALVDKGNSSSLEPLVMDFDGEIVFAEEVFGYLGLDLKRDQIVDKIMGFLNK
jgi:hypothetical protein